MRAPAGAAALLALLVGAVPAAPAESPPRAGGDRVRATLEPGQSLTVAADTAAVHVFEIALAEGEFLRLAADQRGVDVTLVLVSPVADVLAEVDSPTGEADTEELLWVAKASGRYRILVKLPEPPPPGSSYVLSVREVRPSADAHDARIRAQALFADGYKLSQDEHITSQRTAVARLDEARALWGQAGERYQEGLCLLAASASRHNYLSESARAVVDYAAAREIFHALGRANLERESLAGLGLANYRLHRAPEALAAFEAAIRLATAPDSSAARAQLLSNTGMVYDDMGEREKAAEAYARALRLLDETNGPADVRQYTLANLALIHDGLGEKQKALDEYERSLTLARQTKARKSEAIVLANIGRLYVDLGDFPRAESLFLQSLEISRSLGDRSSEAVGLMRMARFQTESGRPVEGAKMYQDAAAILDGLEDVRMRVVARNGLSDSLLRSGDPSGARRVAEEALALSATDPSLRAITLTRLGGAQAALGDTEASVRHLREAAGLQERLGDRLSLSKTSLSIARVLRVLGDLPAALAEARRALDLAESLRTEVVSADLRASFFATLQDSYAVTLDVLAALHDQRPEAGYDREALVIAERGRARSLLDILAEAHVEVREGVDPDLVERERSLRRLVGAKLDAQMRLLSSAHTEEQAAAANREIDGLRARLNEAEDLIRQKSPSWTAFHSPEPLRAAALQREVGADTTLLEFASGETRTRVWAVTAESIRMIDLGSRSAIETLARSFHEALSARNRRIRFESEGERIARIRRADAESQRLAVELGRLLVAPAGIPERRRIAVVAEGALQYVPFAALVEAPGRPPLVAGHEIVVLPSATVLAAIRSDAAGRRPAPHALAVLADPVFDARDPRVRGAGPGRADGPPASVLRSLEDTGEGGIARLPATRREAEAILALVPAAERKAALDFDASRATATSASLSQYRIVHFATHSLLNAAHPDLSGVVLSLVERDGRPQPGFLSTVDVFNLRLPAELVVLSGCRTALGKDVRGEGLVGLTRGFFHAGASRVVSSLWKVDDAATADLMVAAYREMLGPHHASPAAALAAAQRAIRRTNGRSAPYYWAGFTLQGEWR